VKWQVIWGMAPCHAPQTLKRIWVKTVFTQKEMNMMQFRRLIAIFLWWYTAGQFCLAVPLLVPSDDARMREYALKFQRTAATTLAPVYAPLAEQIVSDFQIAEKEGIGIDLGSGPGTLIIELCKRTKRMHWINADINTYFFTAFLKSAEEAGFGHRVSATFADAQALPFKDDYADIIVSRGSFHFWQDRRLAFSEIYRTLKPGGVAFIGRGFSKSLPVEVAREVRAKQKGGPKYDVAKTEAGLREIMNALGIEEYRIRKPKPPGSEGVNYGIWIEFYKPALQEPQGKKSPPPPQVREKDTQKEASEKPKREEDVYVVETVEVMGERLRDVIVEPMSESPGLELSTSLVRQAEMEKQNAKTVVDALKYVPGAWVETRGRKVKQFFSVRGQKYPYPEYAVNGAWQREFHETPYFFSSDDIERIEVIRSSAALLNGLSGLAGIINIIPKEYKEPETSSEIEYGAFDSYRFHMSHGATSGDVSYAVGLGSYHTDGPEGKHAVEGMTNFRGSLHWRPTEKLSLRTNLFHLYGKRELARAEPPAAKRFQETLERFDPFQATLGNVKAHYRLSEKASTELLLHYTDRDHAFINEAETPHESTREQDYEWGINLTQALSLVEDNVLRVGGLYNHWIAPNGKRFYIGRRSDLETISAVIVDEHRFGPLSLDAGVRWAKTYINEYGAFNINGSPKGFNKVSPVKDEWEPSIFNGSLGAAYYPSKSLSFHLNLASGYIQPRRGTLDVNLKEPENERRVKLDLGVRTMQERIGQLSLVGFLTQQRDAIVLSEKTEELDGRIMELYMNRDQNQLGVEFEVRTVPLFDVAEIFFNATAMRSRAESFVFVAKEELRRKRYTKGEMERNEELPRFIAGGGIYASKSNIDLNILAKFVSSYESTRFVATKEGTPPTPQPLGDFLALNANIGWSFGKKHRTRFYLEVENLTDRAFSTVVGYPDYGRRFTVGMRKIQ